MTKKEERIDIWYTNKTKRTHVKFHGSYSDMKVCTFFTIPFILYFICLLLLNLTMWLSNAIRSSNIIPILTAIIECLAKEREKKTEDRFSNKIVQTSSHDDL